MLTLQAALTGALAGSMFAVMALGLTLTWGFLKVINLAHFGVILLGGYLTYHVATNTALGPLTSVLVTAPVMFLLGAAIQWGFERFDVSEFNSLLISYGLLIIIIQVVHNIWTADFRSMDASVNPYATDSLRVGSLVFPLPTVIAAITAVLLVLVAHLVLERTYAGRALRAFSQDRQIASAFGIDHRRLGVTLAGVSGAMGAIAGMLYTLRGTLTPDAPFEWIGLVFAIVILGGIGNVIGTLYAGLLVGAVSGAVAIVWDPLASSLVVFSLVVLALLFRPKGLFPQKAGGH